MNKKKNTKNKNHTGLFFFFTFVVFAFILVLALEYLESKKGNPSIFFETAKPVRNSAGDANASADTDLNLSALFSKEIELIDRFTDDKNVDHLNIRISDTQVEIFRNRLRSQVAKWGGQLKLIEVNKKVDYRLFLFHILKNKSKTHKILLYSMLPQTAKIIPLPQKPSAVTKEKKVAIIIDDIGSKPDTVEKLKKLNIPLTISVLVDEPYAQSEIQSAEQGRFETILHLPMEPHNGNSSPRHSVVAPGTSVEKIRQILDHARKVAPKAKGANNHQGSMATSDKKTMTDFLSVIKDNNLFFIDSRTTVNSVAYQTAQEMGVKSAFRDLFIDHIQTLEHSREQFERLYELLQKKTSAILIGHPHPSSIEAIRESIPKLKKMNVKFVYVSELLN